MQLDEFIHSIFSFSAGLSQLLDLFFQTGGFHACFSQLFELSKGTEQSSVRFNDGLGSALFMAKTGKHFIDRCSIGDVQPIYELSKLLGINALPRFPKSSHSRR